MKFCNHLKTNNQDYFEHMKDAWTFGFKSLAASAAFILHGIMPCTFTSCGGKIVDDLNNTIKQKKNKLSTSVPKTDGITPITLSHDTSAQNEFVDVPLASTTNEDSSYQKIKKHDHVEPLIESETHDEDIVPLESNDKIWSEQHQEKDQEK